jgi:hypothetical protein
VEVIEQAPEIAAQLTRRRAAAAAAWNLKDQLVLVGAGEPIPVPGRYDLTYPFRAHSEYLYLTDRERPGGVLAFDPGDGWTEFVEPVTREELLWSGVDGLDEGVPDGARPTSELTAWLEARRDRPCGCLGAGVPGVSSDAELDEELRYALTHVRRPKDDVELARMRTAEHATRAGFAALEPLIEPGRTERELQIELEAQFFRGGADGLAFETIVAGGAHSAVLHFAPTERALRDGELALIDAGGEYRGYASDVTRTYPVSGSFTPEQGTSMRPSRRRYGPRSRRAGRERSGATCIAPRRSSPPTASSISGSCAANANRCSSAARSRCSSRTGSATWSASASATRVASSAAARSPGPAFRGCASTSRWNATTR